MNQIIVVSECDRPGEALRKSQGIQVASLENVACRHGWITEEKMRELAQLMLKN